MAYLDPGHPWDLILNLGADESCQSSSAAKAPANAPPVACLIRDVLNARVSGSDELVLGEGALLTSAAIFPLNLSVSTNVAFIYINSANNTAPDAAGIAVNEMIRCDSQTSTGTTTLSGDGTYSSFTKEPLYYATQAGELLLDSLYAIQLCRSSNGASQTYTQPSPEDMATGFLRNISYTVTDIGLLVRTNDRAYPAVQCGRAAVYVRDGRFTVAAYALLGAWLLLLLLVTARKLVLDKPELVRSASGDHSENAKHREPFGRVGGDDFGRVMVAEEH
ncbi:hypothetical protein FB451DRAFT_1404848 [Mycena latifolia]|nr:hypothetical protein FB451DRAFT_1404848 [Mycena latifolia]